MGQFAKAFWRLFPAQMWFWLSGKGVPISFSQFSEDIWLINQPDFAFDEGSTCIEVGAFNGVRYSNSALLQSYFKVRAILIEASPRMAEKSRKNRPTAEVLNLAVGSYPRMGVFAGHRAISGLVDHFSEEYKRTWNVSSLESYEVQVVTLDMIFDELKVGRVDFMSIDVQGAELEVLQGLNPEFPISCICIELEGANPDRDEKCRSILRSRGFSFKEKLVISEFWVKELRQPGVQKDDKKKGISYKKFLRPFLEPWSRPQVDAILSGNSG